MRPRPVVGEGGKFGERTRERRWADPTIATARDGHSSRSPASMRPPPDASICATLLACAAMATAVLLWGVRARSRPGGVPAPPGTSRQDAHTRGPCRPALLCHPPGCPCPVLLPRLEQRLCGSPSRTTSLPGSPAPPSFHAIGRCMILRAGQRERKRAGGWNTAIDDRWHARVSAVQADGGDTSALDSPVPPRVAGPRHHGGGVQPCAPGLLAMPQASGVRARLGLPCVAVTMCRQHGRPAL